MVKTKRIRARRQKEAGALMIELLVAMALLGGALLPLAYSLSAEKRLARSAYQHAVAMEIVDGEMEVLLAGEWHRFPAGRHNYPVNAAAAINLPSGQFYLTIREPNIRLEWVPAGKAGGAPSIVREAIVKH